MIPPFLSGQVRDDGYNESDYPNWYKIFSFIHVFSNLVRIISSIRLTR